MITDYTGRPEHSSTLHFMHNSLRGASSAALFILLPSSVTSAQHEGHDMSPRGMFGALGISMNRLGSGTTWIPDAVSLPSRHTMRGPWMLMLHGFVFAQYNRQSGPRGDDQFGSLNWAMGMASRPLGGGVFQARAMLSLDPWSVTARGYPLLLQTGETYDGAAQFDRQHPHDFWMELGFQYDRPLTPRLAWSLYVAPSGEPALGPVAFMHRVSAMDDPVAPLGHHWQDATHISYGVVTTGLFTRRWRLEASAFNGREPDEQRFAMDRPRIDSYSGRLTVNPNATWSATLGFGYLHSPEALHPDEPVHRIVGSVMHGRALPRDGLWSTTLVWGTNTHAGRSTHATLVESEVARDRHTVFGRAEVSDRSAEDLSLSGVPADDVIRVAAMSLGYIFEVARGARVTTGLGARVTVNAVPTRLETPYGSRNPTGFLVFLRVRPRSSVAMGM